MGGGGGGFSPGPSAVGGGPDGKPHAASRSWLGRGVAHTMHLRCLSSHRVPHPTFWHCTVAGRACTGAGAGAGSVCVRAEGVCAGAERACAGAERACGVRGSRLPLGLVAHLDNRRSLLARLRRWQRASIDRTCHHLRRGLRDWGRRCQRCRRHRSDDARQRGLDRRSDELGAAVASVDGLLIFKEGTDESRCFDPSLNHVH